MEGLPQILVLIFCAACIFGLALEAHGAQYPYYSATKPSDTYFRNPNQPYQPRPAAAEPRTDPVEGAPPLSLSLSLLCIRTKWYLSCMLLKSNHLKCTIISNSILPITTTTTITKKKKKTIFLFYLSTSYNIRYISLLYFTHLFIYIYIYIYFERESSKVFYKDV